MVSWGIGFIECANPFNERLHSSLLEYTHQRGSQSFTSSRRNLCNSSFGPTSLLNITSCYLLEFEISCDVCRNENVRKLSAGHEKLGYEIDVPVIYTPVLLPWFFAFIIIAVFLEELGKVRIYSQIRVAHSQFRYWHWQPLHHSGRFDPKRKHDESQSLIVFR